jgi:2-polyprenyl-3-methyl-5-hydroxy-6-metoxy-1,4-benzoquinol methylase
MLQECVVRTEHAPPRRAFAKNGVDVYTCPTCGCIMADVDFVHDQYESDGYYTMAQKSTADIERHWGFRWRHILRTLQRYIARPRILDVGAGNGFFVHLARTELGLHADGLEISDAEVAYAREMFGLGLLRGDIGDVVGRYDAVCSFNVIEHVPDPAALLSSMTGKIRPGGYLVLTTPNPSCVHRRVKGLQNWDMVQPPHHINLFTRESLSQLMSGAGLSVLAYSTISTYINFVRKLDTRSLLLRRTVFHVLKSARLGADHFLICQKPA